MIPVYRLRGQSDFLWRAGPCMTAPVGGGNERLARLDPTFQRPGERRSSRAMPAERRARQAGSGMV